MRKTIRFIDNQCFGCQSLIADCWFCVLWSMSVKSYIVNTIILRYHCMNQDCVVNRCRRSNSCSILPFYLTGVEGKFHKNGQYSLTIAGNFTKNPYHDSGSQRMLKCQCIIRIGVLLQIDSRNYIKNIYFLGSFIILLRSLCLV